MKDKVVVITGASKGLGKALFDEFTSKGAVCIDCSRSAGYDVTKPEDLKRLKEEVIAQYGRIDIWVNNAGVWPTKSFEEMSPEELKDIIDVNTLGTIYGCREVYPYMKERKEGMIVNIVSTSGLEAKKDQEIYCASKFAIKGFTDSLLLDARDHNVRVVGVYPGGMQTGLFKGTRKLDDLMEPKDVARMIVNMLDSPDLLLPELVIKRMRNR